MFTTRHPKNQKTALTSHTDLQAPVEITGPWAAAHGIHHLSSRLPAYLLMGYMWLSNNNGYYMVNIWLIYGLLNSTCTDWWYTYSSETYEFVNGNDDIPYIVENKKRSKPPTRCKYKSKELHSLHIGDTLH